jgi:glycosyltransferase involved in cell wall biosynthesis
VSGAVLLNARFVTQSLTGVQRAAYELGRRLVAARAGVRAVAPAAPGPAYELPVERLQPFGVELRGHAWEQLALRRASTRAALTVGLGNTGPIYTSSRQLVMIHDVNYLDGPAAYSPRFRRAYRLLNGWHARHVRLCTVSQYSADRIAHHFGVRREAIRVIPNGADHILEIVPDPAILARAGLQSRPFFLTVGSANPNKNLAGAIEAFARLGRSDVDLVIVGGRADHIFAGGGGASSAPGVKHLGYVSDGELRSLYEAALGFVFPSFLEGFGVPAIEAMLLGCPVAASNASALPEVCGDAVLYFVPQDIDSIAAALQTLVEDGDLRADLVVRGRAHAAHYTWERSARALLDLVGELA